MAGSGCHNHDKQEGWPFARGARTAADEREAPPEAAAVQSQPGPRAVIVPAAEVSAEETGPEPEIHKEWLKKSFNLSVDKAPLPDVLRSFCAQEGVVPKISDKIQGTLSGDFHFEDPQQFLDLVGRNSAIIWYYDGQAVYFYKSEELESAVLRLRHISAADLRKAMLRMRIWDARWGWRNDESKNLLYVNAPPRFVSLVKSALDEMDAINAQDTVMGIFPLKHATATDQTTELGKERVVIPGVATLLQRIVLGDEGKGAAPAPAPRKLMGTGKVPPPPPSSEGKPAAAQAAQAGAEEAPPPAVRIVAEPRLNAVLVWDARPRMAYYKELIEKLDQPVRLVEIRAAVLDVEVNCSRDLGVAWDFNKHNKQIGGINQGTGTNVVDFLNPQGNGLNFTTIYTHGMDKLMAKVRALEETGNANVLSQPAVLTIDNVQAQIRNTQTFYVKLQGERQVDLVDVTVGTVLQVTPHVIEDAGPRRIMMTVHIEDGTDQSSDTQKVDNVPRVVQSIIDTHAVVGENQALIIGGHYSEQIRVDENGVPVLKDIPGLGALAKTTNKTRIRTERLFVVSPRVVSLDALLPSQGAGLERTFDDTPFIKQVRRANEGGDERNAPRQTRRKKEKAERTEDAP